MSCCDDWPHEVVIYVAGTKNFYAEAADNGSRRVAAFVDPPLRAVDRQATMRDDNRGTTVLVDDTKITPQDTIELPDGSRRIVRSVTKYDYDDDLLHSMVVVD